MPKAPYEPLPDAKKEVKACNHFHKLGLKHRRDGGIMDYADPNKPDRRKFLPSERERIINLYK